MFRRGPFWLVAIASCAGPPPNAVVTPHGTWAIDCVAVLGAPNVGSPTVPLPLEGVPYSGAPRDKLIGDLTDDELGRLCDFDACLGMNGYRHDFCTDRYCPTEVPGDPPVGPFHLETLPFLADEMYTFYATSYGESPIPSREDDIAEYRNYFAACHVAAWEDCSREQVAYGPTPDCRERNILCAIP
jgi:hypothetical protein